MAEMTEVKRVKNAILFHDKNGQPLIRVDGVRLPYAFIGNPSKDEDDDGNATPRWRTNGLLPKETHGEAKKLIEEVIVKMMADNDSKVPKDKWFLSDGDDKEDEYSQGHWIISAADPKNRPKARNRRGEVMDDMDEIDKVFYSGAWAHLLIRPWFFSGKVKGKAKTYPKRVSAGLNGALFYKDDKSFGTGRIDDTDAWGDAPVAEGGANGMDEDEDEL